MELENFIVEGLKTIHYIPNFISENEEIILLKRLKESPKPKWTQLSNRRLQNWGGLPHPKGMVPETIPDWLQKHMNSIDTLGLFGGNLTNHILINEYLPGQGIMPHQDGPLFYPTITTINLGSHTVLDFYLSKEKFNMDDKLSVPLEIELNCEDLHPKLVYDKVGSLVLEPRSLLVLQNDLYTKYLHGIEERKEDVMDNNILNINATHYSNGDILTRQTRVSLTIRYFPKVLKTKLFCTKI